MHLALRMKELGHDVCGFDNLNSYYDPSLKMDRVDILKENGIFFQTGDLEYPEEMLDIIRDRRPDMVIHLASYGRGSVLDGACR